MATSSTVIGLELADWCFKKLLTCVQVQCYIFNIYGFLKYYIIITITVYTSIVRASNSLMEASLFNGMSSVGPKIDGKYSGNSLPRIRLASVTVNGPPFL